MSALDHSDVHVTVLFVLSYCFVYGAVAARLSLATVQNDFLFPIHFLNMKLKILQRHDGS